MKQLVATLLLVTALAVVPVARAETVECKTEQYGGATCGVSTSTTVVEHKVAATGASDQLYTVILTLLGTALVASLLYKLTYRSYILG